MAFCSFLIEKAISPSMVFFQARLRQNYHFTFKVSKLWIWMGGGRGANTFNIHIRMETPRRSNFADYFSFSLDRRFHSKLSSPRVSTSPKYENVSGGHKGIFSDKGIAMPRLVFWQKISIRRIWRGLVLCSLYFDNHIKYLFDEYGMGWYCAHYE